MQSLGEVQKQLKALIKDLRDIGDSLSEPIRLQQKNSKTILVRIPKIILLAKICPFLKIEQINTLSNVCSAMRKTVYGPIGFKILSRVTSPYPIRIVKIKTDFQQKMKRVAMESFEDPHEDYQDEKFIAGERTKFKKILQKKYTEYLKSKEKYEALRQKVRVENSQIFKLKQQLKFHQNIQQELDEQNRLHKQKLKSLSQGFSAKLQDMDNAINAQNKEITKLQNQKQALAGKVREYQNQIQNIKIDSDKKKQILKRLKNYLLYKEL